MRAALYARVSTEDQAVEGFSLDAQIKRLEAYCRVRGWEIADRYRDEGYSGRNTKRPEYERMMSEPDGWDVILVLKMDRIHRNSVNFAQMMDRLRILGKEFSSVQEKFDTTTAMGRFVMDIMQRIAQLESEQIGERTFAGMDFKARNGKGRLGSGHPYGYGYEQGELVVSEDEAPTVRWIFSLRSRGMTMEGIADFLNGEGIPAKKGGKWHPQTVCNILHNPLYAGYLRWNGVVRRGEHDAIIDSTLFERVSGESLPEERCAQRSMSGCPPRSRRQRDTLSTPRKRF